MKELSKVKVWLTCPETHEKELRLAIGDAGIGVIGGYTHCSFVTRGKGYFKPKEGATPYTGKVGDLEEVDEVAIEFVCKKELLPLLRDVVSKHHPYEEVAMDVFPLLET